MPILFTFTMRNNLTSSILNLHPCVSAGCGSDFHTCFNCFGFILFIRTKNSILYFIKGNSDNVNKFVKYLGEWFRKTSAFFRSFVWVFLTLFCAIINAECLPLTKLFSTTNNLFSDFIRTKLFFNGRMELAC
jgi:hypothetical protein